MDQDSFLKVLELVAVSATSVAGGAFAGNRAAKKVATPDEFSTEAAKDLVQRAETRMKEYHDLREVMQGEFNKVGIAAAKLEGRVERSEKDISEATTRFSLELAKLERMMRDGFREVNDKLDGLRGSGPGYKRRASDRDDGQGTD